MGFREWVRTLLEDEEVTQTVLAGRWGVAQPTIAHYRRGTRQPDRERSALISEAEGRPLADIIEMVRQDARGTSASRS